ncbi:hypothetical protein EDC01DRAFT_682380 [Geopyxis carbonaria]|nr:hypothetical protein EDC01DRAFT_682380 [Geopyxis carbonaria]
MAAGWSRVGSCVCGCVLSCLAIYHFFYLSIYPSLSSSRHCICHSICLVSIYYSAPESILHMQYYYRLHHAL